MNKKCTKKPYLKCSFINPILLKKTLSASFKQNKKENPKCDSLFGKDGLWKTKYGFGGQVTYREGTVKTVTPL